VTTGTVPIAFGLAIACGISPYATAALLGIAYHLGWVAVLPEGMLPLTTQWVLTLAVALTIIEFVATLVPGVASVWEAVHTAIRPPMAAVMGALVAWGSDPSLVIGAGLLAGGAAFGTSLTKFGARLAIDTSPEPISNGVAGIGELSLVALITIFIWRHPVLASVLAALIVIAIGLVVRAVWGLIWRTVTSLRRPGAGAIRS
jgi:hypothetical protein